MTNFLSTLFNSALTSQIADHFANLFSKEEDSMKQHQSMSSSTIAINSTGSRGCNDSGRHNYTICTASNETCGNVDGNVNSTKSTSSTDLNRSRARVLDANTNHCTPSASASASASSSATIISIADLDEEENQISWSDKISCNFLDMSPSTSPPTQHNTHETMNSNRIKDRARSTISSNNEQTKGYIHNSEMNSETIHSDENYELGEDDESSGTNVFDPPLLTSLQAPEWMTQVSAFASM
jgi:hypothetical protein